MESGNENGISPLNLPESIGSLRGIGQLVGPLIADLQGQKAVAWMMLVTMANWVLGALDEKVSLTLRDPSENMVRLT